MRSLLWLIFAAALIGDLLVIGWVVSRLRYESGVTEDLDRKRWLVDVRRAFTDEYTTDIELLDARPEALVAGGFLMDDPDALASWSREILPTLPYLADGTDELRTLPPLERAMAIALRFSKNGGPGCGHFRDIVHTLREISKDDGYGCCVDHARAMLALGHAFGLFVRTVRHSGHSFNEVWVPELDKWVMIDSQYAVTPRDPSGTPLSTREVRTRMLAREPVHWHFFGNESHRLWGRDPASHRYFGSRDSFRDLKVFWGANFVEHYEFVDSLAFLPEAAQEVLGRIAGVVPPNLVLDDEHSTSPGTYRALRRRYLLTGSLLFAGTTIPPLALLARRRRPALEPAYST